MFKSTFLPFYLKIRFIIRESCEKFLKMPQQFFQIYCCVGFLSVTKQLHRIDADLLGWWLAERQLPSGKKLEGP
jgi:hypothetical protein